MNEIVLLEIENENFKPSIDLSMELIELEEATKTIEKRKNYLKEILLKAMEENDIKSLKNDMIEITFIEATSRVSIDNDKLKQQFEEIYLQCLKKSQVKSSLRIKVLK